MDNVKIMNDVPQETGQVQNLRKHKPEKGSCKGLGEGADREKCDVEIRIFCSPATLHENIIMGKILSNFYHFTFSCIHSGPFYGRVFQLVQPKVGFGLPTIFDVQIRCTFWP